jgi:chemotaxis protein CheY-P-specific phosphatase CheC
MMRGDDAADRRNDGAPPDRREDDVPDDTFERAEPIDAESSKSADANASQSDASGSKFAADRLAIPLETVGVLNWLGDVGVDGVESRLNDVPAGELSARTEHVKIGYAGAESIVDQFGVEDRAGARIRLRKPFAGTVLVLFPVKSANRAASLMLRSAVEDVESVVSTEMGRDALTELCNAMANGFVDEWAELFDTPIDTGPPVAVQNPEMTLIQRISSVSDVRLYLTAAFRIPEHDVDATIFVFPGDEAFVSKIARLDPEVIDR